MTLKNNSFKSQQTYSNLEFKSHKFTGAIEYTRFIDCKFIKCEFNKINWKSCQFQNCQFNQNYFKDTHLISNLFDQSIWSENKWTRSSLKGLSFLNNSWKKEKYLSHNQWFKNTILKSNQFEFLHSPSQIDCCQFIDIVFNKTFNFLVSESLFKKCEFKKINISDQNNLFQSGSVLQNCRFFKACFNTSKWFEMILDQVIFEKCIFDIDLNIIDSVRFENMDLNKNFKSCDFKNSDFKKDLMNSLLAFEQQKMNLKVSDPIYLKQLKKYGLEEVGHA